ncbi:MAG: InlB B-repeat-containing protein [Oscillospiraceae bacterium]|nr:InlB B-repeat-containing protein [Oscillospiraceae bacterium]
MTVECEQQQTKSVGKVRTVLFKVALIAAVCAGLVYAAGTTYSDSDNRKLQNGSFEEGQTWTNSYKQLSQQEVPSWNTTAFQGKIELLQNNNGVYIKDVALSPTDGKIAAELNADEESTLYQNVKTTPSSVYEWGLDHGGRNGTDTMALVIGPKQSVDPSKPSKAGRDQFMQMIDWLIAEGKTSVKTQAGLGEQLTVYSKKFAENGTFQDNAGNNAFSLTPSTIYTEEWHIWIMADSRATSGTNPWSSYGSNADGSAGKDDGTGNTTVDLTKYYLYTVPAGQTETLFGFVSVGYVDSLTTADKAKTYGNFLDNINFQLYHPLSGSTTTHGSAVVGGSDGTVSGEGGTEGHKITVNNKLATYLTDGKTLRIQAVVKKADAEAGCEFVGVYYTKQDENGNPVTEFLQKYGNEIEYREDLTDAEKKGKWIKSTNADGDIIYTYYMEALSSATDLHFIFIKNPTITYDPNGGKPYVVDRQFNTSEAENVYSFKPATGVEDIEAGTQQTFISPYISHAAEGQSDGWKFMGWRLTGDTVGDFPTDVDQVNADKLGSLLLPAQHTIACDYSISISQQTAAQYFKVFDGNVSLAKTISKINNQIDGVTWEDNGEEKLYANAHKGLTMVAQWRWRQAFIPQVNSTSTYVDSANGGTVEISSVTNTGDPNYIAEYNTNGGKAYHAEIDETVTAKATAKDGFTFEGWYDESGKLVTTNATYSYVETKESVNTYYARFSGSVTQTYIRQVKDGDTWKDTLDDKIAILGRYSYVDAVGMKISSTATAGTGYKFVGWYDQEGNKVAEDKLINGGTTLSYTTTGDATYYARFEKTYTVKFVAQTKQSNGSFKTDNVGGKVSVASVTDIDGAAASSKATANSGAKFLGWFDKDGNRIGTGVTYSTNTTTTTDGVTYYARFEIIHNPTVESKVNLSFIAESKITQIPSAFDNRDAGTGKNAKGYGLDNKYGNTIATGFKYSIGNMTNVSTIQITVTVPSSAYVKVGGTGKFTGNGTPILTDSDKVEYNKGSIQRISGATTLTYYWDASGLNSGTTYGFIIDNLYAPRATASITVNGTSGTKVTVTNGVVNTASAGYRNKSHYTK